MQAATVVGLETASTARYSTRCHYVHGKTTGNVKSLIVLLPNLYQSIVSVNTPAELYKQTLTFIAAVTQCKESTKPTCLPFACQVLSTKNHNVHTFVSGDIA